MKTILIVVGLISGLCQTSLAQFATTNRDAGRIDVYVTPFYNSTGPKISIGPFSAGLASTNKTQFVATIQEMKRKWPKLSFVEMYVAAIRLYDWGYRRESVYWFYSAQYRGRLFGSMLDEKRIGSLGEPGFELAQASSAFHQLIGPYINAYAFGDLGHVSQVLERVKKEGQQMPDIVATHPKVIFKDKSEWSKQNQEVGEGLGKLLAALKEQKDEIKRQRIETGVEAQFSKLADKQLPEPSAKDLAEISRLLAHLKTMEETRDADGMEQDRQALVRLGCFEQREFQLRFQSLTEKNRKALSKIVSEANFINDNWALTMTETNSRIVSITVHRADMPTWEKLIGQFDSGKLK